MDELHPLEQNSLQTARQLMRMAKGKGKLDKIIEGDYVLMARDHFLGGEKLCLRWRVPRRVTKCLSDYVFQVEDLRNGATDDVHGTKQKFYADDSLDVGAILSHVVSFEAGIPVSRLLRLVEQDGKLLYMVHWKGLKTSEDTMEPLARVYEDVPQLLVKLL